MCLIPTLALAQGEAWRLEDEFRFGGSSDLPLGSIDRLVAGPEGSIHVTGRGDVAIHVLGGDGRYVGTIGRGGDGPGEFRVSPEVGVSGDTLWALDRLLRRVSRFTLSGDFIDSRPIPWIVSHKGNSFQPASRLADGTLLMSEVVDSHWTDDDLSEGRKIHLLSTDGRDGGEVVTLDVSTFWLRMALAGDVMMATLQPWSTRDLLATSPWGDGFVVVTGRGADEPEGSYKLDWFDIEGRLTRSASIPFRAARLTRAAIGSFSDRLAGGLAPRMAVSVRDARRALSEVLYTPDYLPAVESMNRSLSMGAVWSCPAFTDG
ncbi:6-bladed beta-propeller [Candidatus Palauibacter sp.]|uniref:6-bladed beta-propeller n=1 Tax=Candidatus Palauibacter sp. TaxID=3101350 RepID=UPI003B52A1E4